MAKKRNKPRGAGADKPAAGKPAADKAGVGSPASSVADATDDAASRTDKRAAARADRKAATKAERAKGGGLPPAPEPRFWFGYDVAWAKILVVRIVIFSLLALDALLQIRHAPRYGAGGFNVAQLPGLDVLGPTRLTYEIAQLASAYLFVLAVFGVATRVVVPIAAALYAWMYFTSQLDGYQHHYLVALVLGIACFVPWQRPVDTTAATPVRTWAVRLILVQLGILYVWAAISKMDPAWLDGRTLAAQITGPMRDLIDGSVGMATAAKLTIVVELTLAATVWLRPAWVIALPLGVAFHFGIVLSGLEIGLFAWLMIAFYALVVPDRIWVALIAPIPQVKLPGGAVVALIGAAAGIGLAFLCRFEHAVVMAAVLAIVPLAIEAKWRTRAAAAGLAHLLAIATWVVVDRATTVSVDYYKFWGGSARRLDDREAAETAYRKLLDIAPDDPAAHYQLGRLLLKRDDEAGGLDELHRAQQLETSRARAYVAEAQYLAGKGRRPEALAKAEEATYAEPGSKEAQALVDALNGKKKPPAAAAEDDSDP